MSDGARAEEVYELAVTLLDVEPPIWRRVTPDPPNPRPDSAAGTRKQVPL